MGKILQFYEEKTNFIHRNQSEAWSSRVSCTPSCENSSDYTMIHIEPENEVGYIGHTSLNRAYILNIYYTNGSLSKSE